jgi:hypothetical protein
VQACINAHSYLGLLARRGLKETSSLTPSDTSASSRSQEDTSDRDSIAASLPTSDSAEAAAGIAPTQAAVPSAAPPITVCLLSAVAAVLLFVGETVGGGVTSSSKGATLPFPTLSLLALREASARPAVLPRLLPPAGNAATVDATI